MKTVRRCRSSFSSARTLNGKLWPLARTAIVVVCVFDECSCCPRTLRDSPNLWQNIMVKYRGKSCCLMSFASVLNRLGSLGSDTKRVHHLFLNDPDFPKNGNRAKPSRVKPRHTRLALVFPSFASTEWQHSPLPARDCSTRLIGRFVGRQYHGNYYRHFAVTAVAPGLCRNEPYHETFFLFLLVACLQLIVTGPASEGVRSTTGASKILSLGVPNCQTSVPVNH